MATTAADRRAPPWAVPSAPTCPPPSCTRTPSAHGEGLIAADGPARRPDRQAHRPLAAGQVHRRRAVEPRQDLVGRRSTSPITEAHYDRLRARLIGLPAPTATCTARTASSAPHPAHRRVAARLHRDGLGQHLRAQPVPPADARTSSTASRPNFTIIDVPSFQADPATEGTRTGTAILVHLERMEIIIVGTEYAGEIKKSRLHGHELPACPTRASCRCTRRSTSAQDGDAAVFFGLSGTGKTTLSADPLRSLIGDDEHGWGDDGVFNFEGGCYAKTIRLSPMYEPDIFQTTRRFGTILENVDLDPRTRELDLDSERFTENTRGAYPLDFIGNADETGIAGHAADGRLPDRRRVRRPAADLAADPRAGRLPLHQRLHRQAGRHRGRRQGADRRRSRPASARRSCRATRASTRRCSSSASSAYDVPVWLVNTGWTGGPYGTGERMNIDHTRAMVRAALDGRARRRRRRGSIRSSGSRSRSTAPTCRPSSSTRATTWADPDAYDRGREPARRDVRGQLRRLRRRRALPAIAAAGPGDRRADAAG